MGDCMGFTGAYERREAPGFHHYSVNQECLLEHAYGICVWTLNLPVHKWVFSRRMICLTAGPSVGHTGQR